MKHATTLFLFAGLGLFCATATVHAKLPALAPEALAKADEAKLKTAWSDKVGAYQLCRSMERTAEQYRKTAAAAGKQAPAATDTPACTDPGPYVAPAPLEAAGAHSPATMATSPPSTKATAAELQGQAKK